MADSTNRLPLPPRPLTREGKPRRLGVELEMKGLTVEALSALVADHLGGQVEVISRYEHTVNGDPAGDWNVELDFAYLKNRGRQETSGDGLLEQLDDAAEDLLAAGSELLVPMEVVTPPPSPVI
jgi:hypothetical protein